MEWIDSLFFEHSAIQAIVVLSLVTAAGLWLGKMHVWGISLGVTFVFFVGILAGHLGISLDADMLNYAESFGLVLFVLRSTVMAVPMKITPRLNKFSLTPPCRRELKKPGPTCLGAAQQTLKQMGEPSSSAALGAAVAYPLGVVGVILAILVIRKRQGNRQAIA